METDVSQILSNKLKAVKHRGGGIRCLNFNQGVILLLFLTDQKQDFHGVNFLKNGL